MRSGERLVDPRWRKHVRCSSEFRTLRCATAFGDAKTEEGMNIAKVPDWMELKPEMMPHLIREHEKLGRTLAEEETVTLLRSVGFEISEAK
jgi:hypothetical protein